jgi:hypothetical protein
MLIFVISAERSQPPSGGPCQGGRRNQVKEGQDRGISPKGKREGGRRGKGSGQRNGRGHRKYPRNEYNDKIQVNIFFILFFTFL